MLAAILRKEMTIYLSDHAGLFQLLVFPLITITLFSFLLSGSGFDGMRVAVVDQSRGQAAAAAVGRLQSAGLAPQTTSAEQMDRAITHGTMLAGVVFPADYPTAPAQVYLSPAQAGVAKSLGQVLEGTLSGAEAAMPGRPPAVDAVAPGAAMGAATHWGTPGNKALPANSSAAGYIILTIFFIVVNLGRSLLMEQEAGVFRRLQGTPVSSWVLFVGKWLPAWFMSFVQAWVFITFAHFALGLDVGPAVSVFPAITVISACASALGLWIGAFAKTENQVTALGVGLSLALAALGGCFAPLYLLPTWLQNVAWAIPQHWALVALQEGIAYRDGFLGILPYLGILTGFTITFAILCARQFGVVLRRG